MGQSPNAAGLPTLSKNRTGSGAGLFLSVLDLAWIWCGCAGSVSVPGWISGSNSSVLEQDQTW